MTDNKALALAAARREIEKGGGKWSDRVTQGQLMGAVLELLDTIKAQTERIEKLERQTEAQQKALDFLDRNGLRFAGDWQEALTYDPGAVVTYNEHSFVALRSINPGKQPPARHGSGWSKLA